MTRAWELGRRAGQAQRRAIRDGEMEGFIGLRRADGSITVFGDDAHKDRLATGQVYLTRYSEQLAGLETTVAWCLTVTPKPRVGVWYRETAKGTLEVLRLSGKTATEMLGEQVFNFGSPLRTGLGGTNLTAGEDILPARLFFPEPGTLKINVLPFWYVDSGGNRKKWVPDATNHLDLADDGGTDHRPAASGATDTHRYVVIDFDPDATTPGLVATDATARLVTQGLLASDIEAVPLASGQLPLWAVRLRTGDSDEADVTFDANPSKSDWVDLRFWMLSGGAGGGSSGSGALTTAKATLSSNVTMTNADTYYDGPSLNLSAGTWLIMAGIIASYPSGTAHFTAKLWDGTTVVSSGQAPNTGAGYPIQLTLSGIVTIGSATTYKVSVASSGTNSTILAAAPNNGAGNNASWIIAVKIG